MGRPKNDDLKKLSIERNALAKQYAEMIIKEHKTIRQVAEECNSTKSTVHTYLKKYLASKTLQTKLEKTLTQNFATKHLHGGEATKQKRLKEKEEREKNNK